MIVFETAKKFICGRCRTLRERKRKVCCCKLNHTQASNVFFDTVLQFEVGPKIGLSGARQMLDIRFDNDNTISIVP